MHSKFQESRANPRSKIALLATLIMVLGVSVGFVSADEPGEILWWDLLTEDAEAAVGFYQQLLGWDIQQVENGSYVILHQETPIGAISQIETTLPDIEESFWLIGIEVGSVRKAVSAARKLGASVDKKGHSKGYAKYAVLEDLQGAMVMFLQPDRRLGGTDGPGAWVWAELWTTDLSSASSFYDQVLGYTRSVLKRDTGDYPLFSTGSQPRAGMVEIGDRAIEPGWVPYIGVEDLEATIEKAKELGGTLYLKPAEEYDHGSVALLADPTDGAFFVYQLEEE
ncbi:MAG: hypothetical protein DRJ61_17690 [Acidobacteria bacterium]|nr:MAG: hypothetical protein DRJ61_17690 [Acidobacteriota bacterium]